MSILLRSHTLQFSPLVVPGFAMLQCRMVSTRVIPPLMEPEALFADVIVPRHLAGPFTYTVPLSLRPTLRIGHQVLVPFGRCTLQGAVVALSPIPPRGFDRARLKEIRSLLPEGAVTGMSAKLFKLSRQVAEQYVAPWGQCLRLVLPPVFPPRVQVSGYELTERGRAALEGHKTCSVKERGVLRRLEKKRSGPRRSSRSPGSADLLRDLQARGWVVEVQDRPASVTLPLAGPPRQVEQDSSSSIAPLLSDSGRSWAEPLFETLRVQGPARVLVQAPWTDRLRLLQDVIRLVLDQDRTTLIIVGEAERAQWIAELIRDEARSIFPVCFHSGLSEEVKAEIWDQIYRQAVRVVVGTRSAIFLPLAVIGVIWIEGEDDAALKEAQEPRYHAREVAWLRAQDDQSVVILSSLHPSLETRAVVEHHGVVIRKPMPFDARPKVRVVDLREYGHGTILSQPLVQAIEQTLGRRAGILLFLNRKGYAGALVCRDCGHVPRCSSCRVALMYSRQAGRLRCSYCGENTPIPEICASCSSLCMRLVGEGTERVEEDAKRLFPQASVIRLDGDTMRRPVQAEVLWRRVEQGQWNIIVGTQLVLRRGLPTMGLVGIVQADAGLGAPDFRSAERTYHMLLDAVSLADSAGAGGQVIVQTNLASHHTIQAVSQNDESVFVSEELFHRTALGYPPAVHLIALLVSGTNEKMVHDSATEWVARLTSCSSPSVAGLTGSGKGQLTARPESLSILGPVPLPVSRLRGRYRWQILVKSYEREAGLIAVRTTVSEMERMYQRRSIKFDVDVDPIEMW